MRHICLMSKIRPETYEAIVEAAFLVFSEDPTASLADVANRAGVGRATLHRHFPGRPELMRTLAKTAMSELSDAIEETTANAESYEESFRLSFHAMVPLANRQLFLVHQGLETDEEVAAIYKANLNELREDVEKAKGEGVFDPAIPTAWIVSSYEHLTYAAWALVQSGEATPKQAAELAWRTLKIGLNGEKV